jgi:integrase
MAVRVELKGIHKLTVKGRMYCYAWRGGPSLRGEPGSPEFMASYNEAIENLRVPEPGKFRALVTLYKESADYTKLAESTRKNWGPWLDHIAGYFGDLRIAQFDRPEKIRPAINRWRSQWADRPRTSDYALTVLSRVLSHAVDVGKIAGNPCVGIKRIYSGDRSEIIWTDADIAQLKRTCSPKLAHAVDLAAHTGLRAGDLFRLCWSHIGEDAITISTGKSGGRCEAIIPLYADLRQVLAQIPRRSPTVLTNSRGQPWRSFTAGFVRAKKKAGIANLHFHDLRGTAATRFYIAGLPVRTIGEILGWTEDSVEKIIRKYVARGAATRAAIKQLNEARRRT